MRCGADLGGHERSDQIALEVMGDEYTHAYWFCPTCNAYTRKVFVDRFVGPEYTLGPSLVERRAGDRLVALIRQCPDRQDKRCRCPAHRDFPG